MNTQDLSLSGDSSSLKEEDDSALEAVEFAIGYRFSDRALLRQALTHRSYAQELMPPIEDNQRLEFLGDAVLQLIVTERLWREHEEDDEGALTRQRSERVSGHALAKASRRMNLSDHILLGKGEEKTAGRQKPSIQADAVEALVGAIFLDAGYDTCAERVMEWLWTGKKPSGNVDYKSRLQEALQGMGGKPPVYKVVQESGPEHEKVFEVEVRFDGKVYGRGTGTTKKNAEQFAAHESLRLLGDADVSSGPKKDA
ncbi:MAG: ribonuclease III [bacterium]|nr:ribonuclease III [bacterium]